MGCRVGSRVVPWGCSRAAGDVQLHPLSWSVRLPLPVLAGSGAGHAFAQDPRSLVSPRDGVTNPRELISTHFFQPHSFAKSTRKLHVV